MNEHDSDWYGPDSATFGDRMAGAREAAGLSQAQLARRLGIRKSTVAGWEDDLSEPRANRLVMLAGMLNVSVMWLMTGEGDGMAGPDEETPASTDCRAILSELTAIRVEMRANVERVARLEKKLRKILNERETV
ncbi:MAG: helix-turn-helix domain-containing protein [Jhaorihella sp.]